jgi:hypothetical protein
MKTWERRKDDLKKEIEHLVGMNSDYSFYISSSTLDQVVNLMADDEHVHYGVYCVWDKAVIMPWDLKEQAEILRSRISVRDIFGPDKDMLLATSSRLLVVKESSGIELNLSLASVKTVTYESKLLSKESGMLSIRTGRTDDDKLRTDDDKLYMFMKLDKKKGLDLSNFIRRSIADRLSS